MKKDWMIRESELDDDQLKVLQATLDRSCIVAGCAGSGKSVLALIKAQRIQRECRTTNYKIIVYTKALCRYMSSGKEELGLRNDFYYYYDWKSRRMPSADYIIVDEIQDFTRDEIQEFVDATGKYFFFFGDTAQSIYEEFKNTIPVDEIKRIVPSKYNVKEWELYRNYRLPVPVAKVAQTIGVNLQPYVESTYRSNEVAIPRFIKYNSQDEQIASIHKIIQRNNLTDVAILLPHNEYVMEVYGKLRNLGGNYELKYSDKDDWRNSKDSLDFNSSNPKVMTYHSAKGLQFEAVFLPYIEKFSGDMSRFDRKSLYVAMTRTYKLLYIMYSSDSLPDPLSDVDTSLYKTTETDEIQDI